MAFFVPAHLVDTLEALLQRVYMIMLSDGVH